MDYYFFSYQQVLKIHNNLIVSYGGSNGVCDKNLLTSALAQPCASFQGTYLHKTLFEMGAAYLFHVTCNHPFVDGNKRIGIMLALLFLSLHGIEVDCGEDELARWLESCSLSTIS